MKLQERVRHPVRVSRCIASPVIPPTGTIDRKIQRPEGRSMDSVAPATNTVGGPPQKWKRGWREYPRGRG
ncbi:hypothetical protein KPH14_004322 [Odynerus spinipes]|uniref:Uncharacterized protein n=1 Tax=Odynerus spinipes TaxID=1348599 RepID=A0AAD9VVF2_9HYME|nr:hypothetical protein KPH14_004322 [Odynerus spinipes]